jgi:hypothetical protein
MRLRTIFPAILLISTILVTHAPGAAAQDAAALWQQVNQAAFDASKAASVANVTITRDRIRITLESGTIQFTQPAGPGSVVFGAAFRGKGRVEVQPPNALEAQQLKLFTGHETMAMEFSEATFSFTDFTFDEVAAQVKWSGADAGLGGLYTGRQQDREDVGAEVVPRIFKGILSKDRKATALCFADLKTSDKGWVAVQYDAMSPEEIAVGRWTNWGGITLFETWMSFPAGGRKAAEAFRDPLAREDVHIRGYRIDATVTQGAELSATTKVTFVPRIAGEEAVVFTLDANLRVTAVKDAGKALAFFQPRDPRERNQSYGDYVAVALARPTQAGEAITLEFEYAGKRVVRQVGPGNYFCQSYGWYPTRENSFATRADFEMNFRSPKKYTLVATGKPEGETVDGDWKISTWKSEMPLAVGGFAFGDYKVQVEKVGAIEMAAYGNREPDDFMKSIFAQVSTIQQSLGEGGPKQITIPFGNLTPAELVKPMASEMANMLRLFEQFFGPYPYSRLTVTNIPFSYGQGWPGLIYLSAASFLDSTQRQALGAQDHVWLTDFFRAHETSHQWWGHRVSWKSYHDQWLSEGFAQFSGNLYVLYRRNEKEFLERLRADRRALNVTDRRGLRFERVGPIWMGRRLASSESTRAYATVIYNKGGFVLNMLRAMMQNTRSQTPDERFITMMRDFCQTYSNQAASTEDFKAIAEKHMTPNMDLDGNRRLDWLFNQYVYGTGIPQYVFQYRAEPADGGKWKVSGTLTRSEVPEGWKDILPLYMESGGRVVRLGWITAGEPRTTFELMLPGKPEKLILNRNEDILADIKQ